MARLTRREKGTAEGLIKKYGIEWYKKNHVEVYRKLEGRKFSRSLKR